MWKWILGIAGTLCVSCTGFVAKSVVFDVPEVRAQQKTDHTRVDNLETKIDKLLINSGEIKEALRELRNREK